MGPSGFQILIILAVVILIFGPSRLPGLGKALRDFKKGLSGEDETDVTESVKREKLDKADEQKVKTESTEKEKV